MFIGAAAVTFGVLYGSFLAMKPRNLADLASGGTIIINGQPVSLPVEPVLRLIALGAALFIAVVTGFGMMSEWTTLALYWYGRDAVASAAVDPIFGRPIPFYLFTLPALEVISGWLTTLAVMTCVIAIFFVVVGGGMRALGGRRGAATGAGQPWRGLSCAVAALLFAFAARVFLGRYDRLLTNATIFTGVNYTDAHITLTGLTIVAGALAIGGVIALVNAVTAPRARWLVAVGVSGVRVLRARLAGGLVRERFHRQAERTGPRTSVHHAQHRDDPAGVRPGSHRAAVVPGRPRHRSHRRREQHTRRSTTFGCGTGARCRTRSARFRRSAPTTTSRTSTSTATTSAAPYAR